MPAGPTYPDTWGQAPRLDLEDELEAHADGRHDHHPTPNTCPAC